MSNDLDRKEVNSMKKETKIAGPDLEVIAVLISLSRKSPEHGNAVMDFLGEDKYNELLRSAKALGFFTK
jgi:hypothetical protein